MSMNAVRLKCRALDIREETVVYKGSYLLDSSASKLREAFVVAQLFEEVVTVDDDELSP